MKTEESKPRGLNLRKKYSSGGHRNFFELLYSGIPISRTLNFANFPITRTKSRFPSSVEHCSFTPDFSKYSIFRTNFRFPWMFVKSGFHCNSKNICQIEKRFTVHCSPSRALSFDVPYSIKL